MQLQQNNFKIGIYSLGLIGGSILKCLNKNGGAKLFAVTRNEDTIKAVKELNIPISDDPVILSECDIVFVCSPISKTVEAIKNLHKINPNALYVDVASLKESILKEISAIKGCRFIGSHPMAGTENSGYTASFAELFEGAVWVLCPQPNSSEKDVELLKLMISLMGAFPMVMDAKEHDKAAALISHLPMLLSQSLMLTAQNNNNAKALASSGFRDTTRLALSNKIMAKDMLSLNKENIKTALENVVNNANKLLESDFFDKNIDKIISDRAKLYNSSGKNNFRNNG